MCEAEDVVYVWAEDVNGTFLSGSLTEEGLLTPVLVVLEDKVTDVGLDERTLHVVQHQVDPGEVSDKQFMPMQENIFIGKGGRGVLCQHN